MKHKLAIEFVLVFLIVPLLVRFFYLPLGLNPLILLWVAAIVLFWICREEIREGFQRPGRKEFQLIAVMVVITFVASVSFVYFFDSIPVFNLIKERPLLFGMICVLYPIFSALPQELIFRFFFCKRYEDLFSTTVPFVLVNAFCFGYIHIIYMNWIAIGGCLIAGLFMAAFFHRFRNLSSAWVLHSLLGIVVFASGAGIHFYHKANL